MSPADYIILTGKFAEASIEIVRARAESKAAQEEASHLRAENERKDILILELTRRIPLPVNYSDGPD